MNQRTEGITPLSTGKPFGRHRWHSYQDTATETFSFPIQVNFTVIVLCADADDSLLGLHCDTTVLTQSQFKFCEIKRVYDELVW